MQGDVMDQKTPAELKRSQSNEAMWGSDVVAAALREQGFPYVALTPGASYRGLHDSIVNYLGNQTPKMLLCLHEEHAVAIAHGWAQVTGEPLCAIVHANVGLMHATMAIFNAWCDRAPVVILGATGPVDAERRRPWIDWIHTAADQSAIVRHYTKWDDQPASAAAAVESIRRAAMIARTRPNGPVYICLDANMQESRLDEVPSFYDVSRYRAPAPTAPAPEDLAEAVRLIRKAKNPLILSGRVSRSEQGWADRVKLAEAMGARVLTLDNGGASFPFSHPLHRGGIAFILRAPTLEEFRQSDLVLALDWTDLGSALTQAWPPADGKAPPPVIACSNDFHIHNGWSMDYQKVPAADLRIATVPEAFISAALPQLDGAKASKSFAPKPAAAPREVPKKGEIGIRDLAAVFNKVAAESKVCMISRPIGWPTSMMNMEHPLDFLGSNGGGGVGGGPGMAVGSALALRDTRSDRLPVAVLGDGDYLMGVNALWTAAQNKIPLLVVVSNNRSYFNDEIHQENVARQRGRPVENRWIGQRIENPAPDLAMLARGQGLEGAGPVTDIADLEAALRTAVARVKAGAAYVLDVVVRGEYAAPEPGPSKSRV
jgi:acetolactate synthase-1/2/3 large subunit